MLRFHPSRFGWILVLTLGLLAVVASAQEYRYRYVSLDQVELPSEFILFDPIAINNSGRIYGTVYDDLFIDPHVAVYADGTVTVLQSDGSATTVNAGGTVGGFVLVDPQNFIVQAALFRGDEVELIPPQPDEVFGLVIALNDPGTALVESDDALGRPTYVLYSKGQTTPLDFGPTVTNPFFLHINNQGIISGTEGVSLFDGARGFRFDTRTGETTLLDPLPTEPLAWGVGINKRGNVLGYSFVSNGIERIGVWDRDAEFKTYFVEGTPEFPTISNRLLFNDNNLIVITRVSSPASETGNSYLVPKPGVRLNLADLVQNLPSGQNPNFIIDINNHGDMIGYSVQDFVIQGVFLLKRTGAMGSASSTAPTSSPDVENGRHAIPPAAAAILRRHLPPLKSGSALPQDPFESLLLRLP